MTLQILRGGTASTERHDTIVLLHGFGSHERDLAPLGDLLGDGRPWISLRAPIEMANGGAAWFEITRAGDPDVTPVEAATVAAWQTIDAELGTDARVIPLGFSQGGLIASQLLRTRPSRIAATVILAGFVLDGQQPADDELAVSKPRVFLGRGGADTVITASAVARTAAWLTRHATLDSHEYPGLGHSINQAEIDDVRAFLSA